ncbi:MAG: YHS domain-containing (seleno)protein [Acidobacteriota bacterium]
MERRRNFTRLTAMAVWGLALILGTACSSSKAASSSAINKDSKNVALKGHDPVAYFSEGKPVKGQSQYQHEWMGAKWFFSSAENRDAFAANPEKYAPQYGGYCAYGVSEGHKAPIDPAAWSIVDGKLYLNYSLDVRKSWQKDIPGRIAKANEHWPKIANKP